MSSILLSNPFVAAPPQAQPAGAEPQTALAVAPTQSTGASGNTGGATSHSGNGSGFGSGAGSQALFKQVRTAASAAPERPVDATPSSIVNAKAQQEQNPLGSDLPEVEMPNPLPTSPILQRMSGKG